MFEFYGTSAFCEGRGAVRNILSNHTEKLFADIVVALPFTILLLIALPFITSLGNPHG